MEFVEKKRVLFFGLPWTFTKYTVGEEIINMKAGFLKTVEDDCYMYKVTDVKLADCEKTGHPVALGDQARIDISYDDLSEEASKVIDFNKETRSITAKKGGTALISGYTA